MSQNKVIRQYEVTNIAFKKEGLEIRVRDNYSGRPYTLPEFPLNDDKVMNAFNSFRLDVNEICEMNLDSEETYLIQPTQITFKGKLGEGLQVQIEVTKKLPHSGDAWKFKTPKRFERSRDPKVRISEAMMTRIEYFKDSVNRMIREEGVLNVPKRAEQQLLFEGNSAA
ncbi:hypothetical protein EHQ12_04165 [Leptospira gomenensis]|uniref:Uncharacterized protein n=2 Tax=Leptospira TaxID=171 RepID=A0A5F1YE96_9LEPT|nr:MULTISPECIES: hypothetical protein [Leptospira]TGK10373.1 hypothetical protein EHO98_22955 [Leptospira stimsonii]TGK36189.1 hypothetical protein EHQ17_04550 [Leptospira gomenensis]TGK42771.1 hypothetical protein EHQ07_13940 [Leptospira gomenensis]TGK42960.1 hypothetical protein EHQ12_04165 [Leptospira gomenensis]TGK54971.1 hypothetical protein EHQ13_18420 [Leptospira gomenensis]